MQMGLLKYAIIQQYATQKLSDTSISIRFVKCLSPADTEKCQRYLVRSFFLAKSHCFVKSRAFHLPARFTCARLQAHEHIPILSFFYIVAANVHHISAFE